MGLWIGAPRLNGSESVVWRKLALFVPNHIDAVAGGERWETPPVPSCSRSVSSTR